MTLHSVTRMREMITVERLREVLRYAPGAGEFRWRVSPSRGVMAGAVAGTTCWRGYRHIKISGRLYLAHRLAWLWAHGEWPDGDIDHIDGDRANNRLSNLRIATRSQNLANTRRHRDNASGFKGVTWVPRVQKWMAQIRVGGRTKYLGYFATPEEAHAAYLEAARQAFGEFARAA